jgi:hypothetical protein
MKFVTQAAFGVAVSLAAFGSASAAPVTFTWNPTGIGLTTVNAGSNIVANNITVADYADIVIAPGGAFTENAVIVFTAFDLSGNPAVYTPPAFSPLFNGMGATYSFFATITANGNTSGIPLEGSGTATTGTFTSATYTLWANPAGSPGVTAVPGSSPLVTGAGSAFPLFGGALVDGTETLTAPSGGGFSPKADLDLTLTACTAIGQALASGDICTMDTSPFFVNPLPSQISLVVTDFSASTSQTHLSPGVPPNTNLDITGGGGNVTFEVAAPEPASLLVIGTSLLGLGIVRRRKRG